MKRGRHKHSPGLDEKEEGLPNSGLMARGAPIVAWALLTLALTLALVLPVAPAAAQDLETARYKDWTLRCQPREGLPACDVFQAIVDRQQNRQLLQLSVAYSEELDKYAFQAILPLGFLIQPGALVRVDGGAGEGGADFDSLKVSRCEATGCFLEGEATAAMIEAFSSGLKGQIVLLGRQGEPFAIPFSLEGFSAARQEMLERS